jgi:hypothetical protein
VKQRSHTSKFCTVPGIKMVIPPVEDLLGGNKEMKFCSNVIVEASLAPSVVIAGKRSLKDF